ncbi:MAG TPA: PASTA domain-containing protein [Bacteroidia bacterium]|nr:PASTA domain-containing protein [Bacteroidia bacterium]
MAKKFISAIGNGRWWIKLLLAIVFLVVFLLFVNWLLKFLTNHGQNLPVPKVKGLVYEEATKLLDENELEYVIFDSVYVPKAKKDEIIEQNPAPGSKVKKGRKIYLTINARKVPMVKMPDLTDINLREAISKLQGVGLEAGKITTVPDISTDLVLDWSVDGKKIKPGSELPKGTKVDLKISKGEKDADKFALADLTGLTLDEARIELSLAGLNIGTVIYDDEVTDKNTAVVYRQSPKEGSDVYTGKEIDLFLKQD